MKFWKRQDLAYKDHIFYIAIDCADITNKFYVRSIDLILEAIKLTLYLRSKEEK